MSPFPFYLNPSHMAPLYTCVCISNMCILTYTRNLLSPCNATCMYVCVCVCYVCVCMYMCVYMYAWVCVCVFSELTIWITIRKVLS